LDNKLNNNTNPIFIVDPTDPKGTVGFTAPLSVEYPAIILNSAKPFDKWTNEVLGDSNYGDPMPALDILSNLYKKARITSVDIAVKFMVDLPTMDAYTDATIQSGVLRFGCYLSSEESPFAAWSQIESATATAEGNAAARLYEAYRAGLLTTVPLVIGNRREDMHKQAELVMRKVNIMDQFQEEEDTITGPDPTNFAFNLPNLRTTTVQHEDIDHPATKLWMHFFYIIDRPLTGFAATTEDTSINILSECWIQQNYLLTSPAGKIAEDENPDNST
jgi:hypothetical protein